MSKEKNRVVPERNTEPTLGDAATRAGAILGARMEQAPYQTMGIAIGIGVVLGGGMWRLLARSMFGLGARSFIDALAPARDDNQSTSQNIHQSEARP